MNRDFTLAATPATARRLLRLEAFGLIDLPAGLAELAMQDCVGEAEFEEMICPYHPERAVVTQFLLDNDLRGIVQATYHPRIDEITLLNAVRLAQVGKVSILTRRPGMWRHNAKALFLQNVDIRSPSGLTGEWIDSRRDGALIMDICPQWVDSFDFIARRLLREFPQVLLYQSRGAAERVIHWTNLATILFPTMPDPLTLRSMHNPSNWLKKPLHAFAPFYNVCVFPEFISEPVLKSLDKI